MIPSRIFVLAALVLHCFVATPPVLAQEDAPYRFEALITGVTVAFKPEASRFQDSNSLIIDQDNGSVLVDTPASIDGARALIEHIRLSSRKLKAVIHTHWHSDHTQTATLFREAFPDVQFIGHETLTEDIEKRAAPALLEEKESLETAIADARIRLEKRVDREGNPLDESGVDQLSAAIEKAESRSVWLRTHELISPDLVFSDSLRLESRHHPIVLYHLPGHTRGDIVVWMPKARIVFTGDLIDDLPYGGHGYLDRWDESLERVASLDVHLLVPGHGRSRDGDQAATHIKLLRSLFSTIRTAVARALDSGQSLEALSEGIDLSRFKSALAGDDATAGRAFDQFVPATIEREYQRQTDEAGASR